MKCSKRAERFKTQSSYSEAQSLGDFDYIYAQEKVSLSDTDTNGLHL